VAHRDVKPANVLFDGRELGEGNVKLCDFGFALKCDDRLLKQQCGTPNYFAPELTVRYQGDNGYQGRPVDMWAFGCLIFECLHGTPAFTGGAVEQIFVRIRAAAHAKFALDLGALPKSLLKTLFAKDPAHRPTADQICDHAWISTNPSHVYDPFSTTRKASLDDGQVKEHQPGFVPVEELDGNDPAVSASMRATADPSKIHIIKKDGFIPYEPKPVAEAID